MDTPNNDQSEDHQAAAPPNLNAGTGPSQHIPAPQNNGQFIRNIVVFHPYNLAQENAPNYPPGCHPEVLAFMQQVFPNNPSQHLLPQPAQQQELALASPPPAPFYYVQQSTQMSTHTFRGCHPLPVYGQPRPIDPSQMALTGPNPQMMREQVWNPQPHAIPFVPDPRWRNLVPLRPDLIPESINLVQLTMIQARGEMNKILLSPRQMKKYGFPYLSEGGGLTSDASNWIKSGCEDHIRCDQCHVLMPSPEPCRYHPDKKFQRCCIPGANCRFGCQTRADHVPAKTSLKELSEFRKTPAPTDNKDMRTFHVLAIDTEMVYTTKGLEAARAVIINQYGHTVLDVYIRPTARIIDYNTMYSGVRAEDLENAMSPDEARQKIFDVVNENSVLIGHHLSNDLKVLKILHWRVIDTAALLKDDRGRLPSLKYLAWTHLKKVIHNDKNGHDPIEDAKICFEIVQKKWKYLVTRAIVHYSPW